MSVWLNLEPPENRIGFLISSGGHNRAVLAGGFALTYKTNALLQTAVRIRTSNANGTEWLSSEYEVVYREWFHVAVTWGVDGVLKLYINGVQKATVTARSYTPWTQFPAINSTMHLGKRSHEHDFYAKATMDELRIWTRNLTSDEIIKLVGAS